MRFISEEEIADALDRVTMVRVHLKGEKIFLQLYGPFLDEDASRILHMDTILAVSHPVTGDLEEHATTIGKIERAGEGMICLIEAKPGTFRVPRIPIEANDNGLSQNVSYVELRFGTKDYPRGSLFVIGISMAARPERAVG